MFPNQNQSLPFNPQQPQFQTISFNFNNPPIDLSSNNYFSSFPSVNAYVRPITSAVANAASSSAGASAVKTFTFNQLANNSYNNNDFQSTVACAFDLFLFEINQNNTQSNMEPIINKCAYQAFLLMCALNLVRNFPQLQSYYPSAHHLQSAMKDSDNVIDNTQQKINMVNQIKTKAFDQYQQQNHQQNHGFNINNNSGFQNAFGGSNDGIKNGMFSARPMQNESRNLNINENFVSKFEHLQNLKNQQNLQQTNSESQTSSIMNEDLSINDWKPSNIQFYIPAYNSLTHELIFKRIDKDSSGTVIAVIIEKDETSMEREKHQHLKTNLPTDNPNLKEERENKVQQVFFEKENANIKLSDKDFEGIKDILTIESFEEMKNYLLLKQAENAEKIFSSGIFHFLELFLTKGEKDVIDFVEKLSKNNDDFLSIQKLMKDSIKKGSEDLRRLISQLDVYLTKKLNYELSCFYGLGDKIIMDDFINDISLIPNILNEEFGSIFEETFLNKQSVFLSKNLKIKTLDDVFMEDFFGIKKSAFLPLAVENNIYSIYLDIHSDELRLGVPDNTCAQITMSKLPFMFKFCKTLLAQGNSDDTFIIATSDNIFYEISETRLMPDGVSICKYKK